MCVPGMAVVKILKRRYRPLDGRHEDVPSIKKGVCNRVAKWRYCTKRARGDRPTTVVRCNLYGGHVDSS